MTKEEKKQSIEIVSEFTLSDGTKVAYRKADGFDILKARQLSGKTPYKFSGFMISEIATFNNKKLAIDDVLALDVADYLLLEEKWNELTEVKNSQPQET